MELVIAVTSYTLTHPSTIHNHINCKQLSKTYHINDAIVHVLQKNITLHPHPLKKYAIIYVKQDLWTCITWQIQG
jgi:hypothetical protein